MSIVNTKLCAFETYKRFNVLVINIKATFSIEDLPIEIEKTAYFLLSSKLKQIILPTFCVLKAVRCKIIGLTYLLRIKLELKAVRCKIIVDLLVENRT